MKKTVAYIIILTFIISISGCGGKESDRSSEAGCAAYFVESIEDMVNVSDAVLLVEYMGAVGETVQGDQEFPSSHTKIQMGSYYAENNYKVLDVIAGEWDEETDIFTGLQYIGVCDYIFETFEEKNDVNAGDILIISIDFDRQNDIIYLNPFEGAKHCVDKNTGRIRYSTKLKGYRKYRTVKKLKEAFSDR